MNNKLTFTGGEPNMREDDFLRIQRANRELILGLLVDFGDCIVAGANGPQPAAGDPLILPDDGFVYLNGEMLKVDAGSYPAGDPGWTKFKYVKVTTFEAGGDKTFLDANPRQTWEKNRAVPTSVVSLAVADLDAIAGLRWTRLGAWQDITESSVMEANPTSTCQVRYNKGYLEISGSMIGSGAPGSISLLMTLPAGYYELLSRVDRFVCINEIAASGATEFASFKIDSANGQVNRNAVEGDVTGADNFHINVRIPLFNQ